MSDSLYMDLFEFVCCMTVILVSGLLLFVYISTKNAIKMQEMAEKVRLSNERSKAAKARYEQPGGEVGPWVEELLKSIGISPEVLFTDEMPAELVRFMPMIKGFIQGGGLQKILGGAGGGTSGPGNDDKSAI